jgi:hypothetical protein
MFSITTEHNVAAPTYAVNYQSDQACYYANVSGHITILWPLLMGDSDALIQAIL